MRLIWVLMITTLALPRIWERLFNRTPQQTTPAFIRVRALTRVWTEARVDDEPRYRGWLAQYQELDLDGGREVYVWCGQADKLSVFIHGERAGTLSQYAETPERSPGWFTFRNHT